MLYILFSLLLTTLSIFAEQAEHIAAKAGQTFMIELDSNPTTGYSWVIKKIVSKATRNKKLPVISVIKESFSKDADDEHLIGAGGTQVWLIRALARGTARITLNYERPWEKKAVKTKEYIVEVR